MTATAEIEITEEIAHKVLTTVDAGLVAGLGNPILGQMCVEAAVCYAMGLPHSDEPTCVSQALRSLKISLNDSIWSSNLARAAGMRRLALAQLGSKGALDDKDFVERCVRLVIGKYVPKALRSAASVHPEQKHKDALEAAAERCEAEASLDAAYSAAADAADDADKAADAAADAAYAADAAANARNAAKAAKAASASAYAADAASDAAKAAKAASAADADAASAYAADTAAMAAKAAVPGDAVLSEFAEDVVQILIQMGAPGCQWLWMTEAPAAA